MEAPGSRLKIAFLAPVDAHGHVNAMLGLADQLSSRGHRAIFICNDSRTPAHFGHETISARNWSAAQVSSTEPTMVANKADGEQEETQPEELIFTGNEKLEAKWAQMVDLLDLQVSKSFCFEPSETSSADARLPANKHQSALIMDATSVANSLTRNFKLLKLTVEREIIELDASFERIILHVKPDLLVVDQLCPIPAVYRLARAGLRWLSLASANPMGVYWARARLSPTAGWFPAPLLGAPVDRKLPLADSTGPAYERALQESGMQQVLGRLGLMAGLAPADQRPESVGRQWAEFALNQSPWLNLYTFPAELDYALEHPELSLGPLWVRLDALIRKRRLVDQEERLLHQVGAWRADRRRLTIIYASLGSTASANLALLNNLLAQIVGCCARKPDWRFAVALGSRAHLLPGATRAQLDRLEAQRRLVARSWWPQPELFRRNLVDACVSHAGNNTLCELFRLSAGAPPGLVLVCAFHDQLDNARRLDQLGLGVALGAFQLLTEPADLLLELALERSLQVVASRSGCSRQREPPQPADFAARLIEQKFAADASPLLSTR